MQTNAVPYYDDSTNTTACCARFNPDGWDNQILHFEDKPFLRAFTHSAMHIPLDMGHVFTRVQSHMEEEGAYDPHATLVLSRDRSAWNAEHLFAITRPVPGEEMTTLSGDFLTRVFEGPYRKTKDWLAEMEHAVQSHGNIPGRVYFFYTTCPKCAKAYGENYIIGVAEML